ncbi:hypothetical protein CR983_02360 [Candidatus Saccharibacteria bacterium]|nr:MAG: hypothetical protein CR983_02360 [Candidatus Saccharibacteria bacterium]
MRRKSVIRAFARAHTRSCSTVSPRLGRPRRYTAETEAALAWVWEQYAYPCAERLHGEINEAIRIFKRDKMWHYGEQATEQLLTMSLGAMKLRTVAMARRRGLVRGISTTRSGALLQSVPVFCGSWAHKGPGYGQVDTVVHSGVKLMGAMVYTVNYVDVATYWQEPVAQLDKTAEATLASLRTIAQRLPWQLKGLHPDNGSEFINELGIDWCKRRRIELTRSRPNKKNDNCYIEQRNNVTARKYIGYERYDCEPAAAVMNELYEVLRLYLNFFQPTFKLESKQKQAGGRYKRIYGKTKKPYQLALARPDIDQAVKDRLIAQYESLNPKVLRDRIKALTNELERTQRAQGYRF